MNAMECLHPISLARPHGSGVTDRINVPCGKCAGCIISKRQNWSFRLGQEWKKSSSAFFLSITYNDESITWAEDNIGLRQVLMKKDLQDFIKRLRYEFTKYPPTERKFKYYAVGEYGDKTSRPHYHCIVFNLPVMLCDQTHIKLSRFLSNIWKSGNIHVGSVTDASINYVTKYVINRSRDNKNDEFKSFSVMSLKPAIGFDYINETKSYHNSGNVDFVTKMGGVKQRMPRYYKDKIFDAERKVILAQKSKEYREEKENLFIENCNKMGQDANKVRIEAINNVERYLEKLTTKRRML